MKVPVTEKTLTTCRCKSCPTLMQQLLSGALFCSVSAREKVSERHGCNCVGCQVHADYALSGEYFCVQSAADNVQRSAGLVRSRMRQSLKRSIDTLRDIPDDPPKPGPSMWRRSQRERE